MRVGLLHKHSGSIVSIRQLVQLIHSNPMRQNLILLIDTIFFKIIFEYHEFYVCVCLCMYGCMCVHVHVHMHMNV